MHDDFDASFFLDNDDGGNDDNDSSSRVHGTTKEKPA